MSETWIDNLKPKDIPFRFRGLPSKIGMPATIKVIEHFQGTTVYFGKINGHAFEKVRNRLMHERLLELKKSDTKGATLIIAREFGVSDRRVRQILYDNDSSSSS